MTGPTREEAFEAFCTLIAYAVGQRAEPPVYHQKNLPPDAKNEGSYKRRHRVLRAADTPGVWVRGKLLCCTAEAWATVLPRFKRPIGSVPGRDIDAEIDAALGIRSWTKEEIAAKAARKAEDEVATKLSIKLKRPR